jgi:hypothetical protein
MAHWLAVCLPLAAALGCSSEFPVYPVQGRVNFEGKPMVGGGSISFVPLKEQEGKTAAGEIAADGSYRLTTNVDGDGSMPGEYRVVIVQQVDQEPQRTGDGEEALVIPASTLPVADRIPAIYADPTKSPLRATVEAQSENKIDIELKRNPQ